MAERIRQLQINIDRLVAMKVYRIKSKVQTYDIRDCEDYGGILELEALLKKCGDSGDVSLELIRRSTSRDNKILEKKLNSALSPQKKLRKNKTEKEGLENTGQNDKFEGKYDLEQSSFISSEFSLEDDVNADVNNTNNNAKNMTSIITQVSPEKK